MWGRLAACGGLATRLERRLPTGAQLAKLPRIAASRKQKLGVPPRVYVVGVSNSATEKPRRNAMQQFIAKFEKEIHGVMSGFDRVLFRGSLRRLNHSKGMKWYLAENNILCKQYEDHVKAVSQKVKKAALQPFQQQMDPEFGWMHA